MFYHIHIFYEKLKLNYYQDKLIILNYNLMDKISGIIEFITDAYIKDINAKSRVRFDGKFIIIELKQLSQYINNIVKLNISYDQDKYIISPCDSDHDSIIGAHIIGKTLEKNNKSIQNHNKININNHDIEYFIELLVKTVNKYYDSFYKLCPICYNDKKINKMILEPCKKCIPYSFNKIYGNIVLDLYKRDINLFKLLVYTALNAVTVPQRFMPIPKYCLSGTYEKDKLAIITDMQYYIDNIIKCDTDKQLRELITENEYMFLKHVITSNNTELNYFDMMPGFSDRTLDRWSDKGIGDNKVIIFTVNHPYEKQQRFDTSSDMVHMFHGSNISNWYSILRNGLKNYSGTELMSCGQAYGPGIYLASTVSISMSYCTRSLEKYGIMGVVQVLNSSKYEKTSGIYVVPDESDVLLKYLILLKPSTSGKNLLDVQKFLTVELPETMKNNMAGEINIMLKRINKEYMELMKKIEKMVKTKKLISVNIDKDINEGEASMEWKMTIKYNKNDKDNNVVIKIKFPQLFPSIPCIISSLDPYVVNIPMFQPDILDPANFRYIEPIMRYDKWRADVKVYKIIEYMILNVVS